MTSKVYNIKIAPSTRVFARLENLYLKKVKDLVLFLENKKMHLFAGIVATFLIEPQNALYAAYLMHKSFDQRKLVNLNPKYLSQEQLKCSPVLFIHGDSSNSRIFAPMITQVAKESPFKPIFTIDLTSRDGTVSAENHLPLITEKVNEIAGLYSSSNAPIISFVGHSSGGDILGPLMQTMKGRRGPQCGISIKIGSYFKKNEAKEFRSSTYGKVIEILGTKDVLEGCDSHLPNQLVVESGHLGLLFNKAVIDRVSQELYTN
jgi:uncharacterized alpha/beta hydrolase family protein